MISCTEFTPAYSEFFAYLEDKKGKEEVRRFWDYLFAPTGKGIPLINFVKAEGIAGCFSYWKGTLNEEAADFTMYLNEKAGWFRIVMHRCPSKGRILELSKSVPTFRPYEEYCFHCDYYRHAVEKIGLKYIYDFIGIDKAACSIFIYDPEKFDGRIVVDKDTLVMDRHAYDNEYFHPDFHSSMNMSIDYLGENYGPEGLEEYCRRYVEHVYSPLLEKIGREGLAAVKEKIEDTYAKEKASEVLRTVLSPGSLEVYVERCPAVTHLKASGREVSAWFRYSTEYIMKAIAEKTGYGFEMLSYDDGTGKASYRFTEEK